MKAAEPARIVFLDRDTMPADISLRQFAFPHEFLEFGATEPDKVAERIASADIVITNKVPIRVGELTSASKLRLIAIAATGSDVVDIKACALASPSPTSAATPLTLCLSILLRSFSRCVGA
jgi:glycerate dehydrogenase